MGLFSKSATFETVIVGIDSLCIQNREIRVENDIVALDMTLINNAAGPGVIVSQLGAGGSAADAGLVVGDVIRYVNGEDVRSHEHAFELMRECHRTELSFVLSGSPRVVSIDKSLPGKLLIEVSDCGDDYGVQVTSLGEEGRCFKAGIEVGDVILSINGTRVTQHQHAIELLDAEPRLLEVVIADANCSPRSASSRSPASRRPSGTPSVLAAGFDNYRVGRA